MFIYILEQSFCVVNGTGNTFLILFVPLDWFLWQGVRYACMPCMLVSIGLHYICILYTISSEFQSACVFSIYVVTVLKQVNGIFS